MEGEAQQASQDIRVEICAVGREGKPVGGRFVAKRRLRDRAAVDRSFLGERMRGNFRGDLAMIQNFRDAAVRDRADDHGVEAPLLKTSRTSRSRRFFRATSNMRSCDSLSMIS